MPLCRPKIPVYSELKLGNYPLQVSVYSDGSVDVKFDNNILGLLQHGGQLNLLAALKCPAGLLALRYFLDYVEEYHKSVKLNVILPFVPNGRQDRVTGNETTINVFSLKSVGELLKSPNIVNILVTDPHSNVTPALLKSSSVLPQEQVFSRLADRFDFECDVIVAPDAGAFKKSAKISQLIKRPLVLASKKRDLVTNELSETEILAGSIEGKHVAIVDDICDGGRTFIALAKVLKEQGASKVSLFVTHGIFSYGILPLQEYIDDVFVYYNWLEEGQFDPTYLHVYLDV